MKDTVAEAIARTLGVSSKCIAAWELHAQQDGRPGMMGTVRTQMRVKIVADVSALRRLQDDFMHDRRRGSWALQGFEQTLGFERTDGRLASLDVILLYGKETQHIFKALAHLVVYRKPAKRRK